MKKSIDVGDFLYCTYPKLTTLVTCFDDGRPNALAVTWSSPISSEPPLYGISLHAKRYSHDIITRSGEFVVNFLPYSTLEKLHYCGRHSGRQHDKFKEAGLTLTKAEKVKAPLLAEAYAALECVLYDAKTYGDHTLFVGEVVAVTIDDAYVDEQKKIIREGTQPIYYLGSNTYTSLGTFERKTLPPK